MNLFIDTNIFLSFYHLSSDDLEEIHKLAVLLDKREVVLWLPEQVKNEFHRNRENKISDALKKLQEQQRKPQFPQICKDYKEYAEIRELQRSYEQKISSLLKNVTEDVETRNLKADEKINELFRNAKCIETSKDLVEKARFRMDVRNPPGKDGSLGDAINWEGLLASVPDLETLYLIADDKDYYSVLNENKLKDFLSDEWNSKKQENVVYYRRLSQFFKEHYPSIKLASELEKELAIRNLVNSGNFASTHYAIAKLENYSEYNKSEVNEIVSAALVNNQINWILSDKDVLEFYKEILSSHRDKIDSDALVSLEKELKPYMKSEEPA